MDYVTQLCPQCSQELEAPNDLVGQSVQCPTCDTLFTCSPASEADVAGPPLQRVDICMVCTNDFAGTPQKSLYGSPVCAKCVRDLQWRRGMAAALDYGSLLFLVAGLFVGLTALLELIVAPGVNSPIIAVTVAAPVSLLLFLIKDARMGFSPGKLICGVKALHEQSGAPAGLLASIKRTLPLLMPLAPLLVRVQLMSNSREGYRLGAGWANTRVVPRKHAECPVFKPWQL